MLSIVTQAINTHKKRFLDDEGLNDVTPAERDNCLDKD